MRKLSGIMVISISVILIMALLLPGCGSSSTSTTTTSQPTSTTTKPTSSTSQPTSTTTKPTSTTSQPTSTTTKPTSTSTSTTATGGTIKIGVMTSISGFFSSMAPYMLGGAEMVRDQVNKSGGLLGKQIELIEVDDMADPSHVPQASSAMKDAGAVAIIGSFLDACHAALQTWAGQNKMIVMAPSDTVPTNRWSNFNKYVFFQWPMSLINGKVFAHQIAAMNDVNNIYYFGSDVSMNYVIHDTFWDEMHKIKPSVKDVGVVYAGSQETNYMGLMTAALAKKADLSLVLIGGPSWPPFVAAAQSFKFFEKTKAAIALNLDGYAADGFGHDYPTGLYAELTAPYWLDTPEMKAFTKAFNDKTGKWPSELTAGYYMSMLELVEAIKKAGTTDTDKVIAAMETLTIKNTILGDISFNDYDHQANSPMWWGISTISEDWPLAIAKDMIKTGLEFYPTKDEVLANRAAGK
jgi:branched-chain amino acid transport system substrate-binding protein